MVELYPAINDPVVYQLQVDDTHRIYVEECGNPRGIPVIFLHGGPGSGCRAYHRQFFDPQRYRIILFDQRGCGRSTPHGWLENNTTQNLLGDMESIRTRLQIDQWLLFGGSWGVALALYYAQTHPERVSGMILRGAFLASQRDLDWFYADGVARIFPDEWQRFFADLDPEQHTLSDCRQLLLAYQGKLNNCNAEARLQAAKTWDRWTTKIVTWTLPQEPSTNDSPQDDGQISNRSDTGADDDKLIRSVKLEIHYATNRYFLKPDQLINNIASLPDVPVTIIHGRRDLTCPLESSWRLQQAIPGSSLNILPEAGHLANEPSMIDALVSATDTMAKALS